MATVWKQYSRFIRKQCITLRVSGNHYIHHIVVVVVVTVHLLLAESQLQKLVTGTVGLDCEKAIDNGRKQTKENERLSPHIGC